MRQHGGVCAVRARNHGSYREDEAVLSDRAGLRGYPDLNLASPYSHEKVGNLDPDGSFGSRTEAALKAVQKHIGTAADGIYGPDTRDHIKFLTPDRVKCYRY